jgi:hypothetical protein
MPADDPTSELNEILKRVRAQRLPAEAGAWAKGALATATDILDTISNMESNRKEATDAQEEALKNIYIGACRWLHRLPNIRSAPRRTRSDDYDD